MSKLDQLRAEIAEAQPASCNMVAPNGDGPPEEPDTSSSSSSSSSEGESEQEIEEEDSAANASDAAATIKRLQEKISRMKTQRIKKKQRSNQSISDAGIRAMIAEVMNESNQKQHTKLHKWNSEQPKFDCRKANANLNEFFLDTEARNYCELGKRFDIPRPEMLGKVADLFVEDTVYRLKAEMFVRENVESNYQATWLQFKSYMLEFYNDCDSHMQLIKSWRSIKQTSSHDAYVLQLTQIMGKFDSSTILDRMLLYQYLVGLKPEYLSFVQNQNPKSLNEALSYGNAFARRLDVKPTEPGKDRVPKRAKETKTTENESDKKRPRPSILTRAKCLRCGSRYHQTDQCYSPDTYVEQWKAKCEQNGVAVPEAVNNPLSNKASASNYFGFTSSQSQMHYVRGQRNVQSSLSNEQQMQFLGCDVTDISNQMKGEAFLDCGSSFDAVSSKFAKNTEMSVTEYKTRPLKITVGGGQEIVIPRRVGIMQITILNIGTYRAHCFVLDMIPEDRDVLFGVPFLKTVNPLIDWVTKRMPNAVPS